MGINEYIKIGSRIKELRKLKGLSQRDMANRLNLSFSTYSNYENNYREPKFEIIEKIADILGVTIQYLVGIDSSNEIIEQYHLKKGIFIDYLYSLGYSVETPLEPSNFSSYHYISYNDETDCKVVDAIAFKNFQDECNKYILYSLNNLLEKSTDIDDFIDDEQL